MKDQKNISTGSFAIKPEHLASQGAKVLDFLVDYFNNMAEQPVRPNLEPGYLAAQFAAEPPQNPQEMNAILQEIQDKVMPGVTHWQHPQFFAYYPATTSIPAMLSELIISAIGSVGLQWSANPIATELECVVMDWIMGMLHGKTDSRFMHRSGKGGGLIQNTAGEALIVVMTAARTRKQLELKGINDINDLSTEQYEAIYYEDSSHFVIYMSDQTHFSGPKAARVTGMRVRQIPSILLENGNYGITADQVSAAMAADRAQGLTPTCVQLNWGSTNTCGYDDLASFIGFEEQEKVWVHTDAAYAGASLILPEFRQRSEVLQQISTSFNFNGSKWFLCGFDSAFLFVRDRRFFKDVFAASGDYMASSQDEQIYNPEFKDWAVPLGRRFRSLRIWMVLQYFGTKGLHAFLQESMNQADWLRQQIDQSDDFKQVVNTDLGLVCISHVNPEKNKMFIESLQKNRDENQAFLFYPSVIKGKPFIRIAIGGANTTFADVEKIWDTCQKAAV